MISVFQPHNLWERGVIVRDESGKPTNWNREHIGTWVSEDWEALVRWLRKPIHTTFKEERGAFTLARLKGKRCIKNVEHVSAIGIDGDNTNIAVHEIHRLLSRYKHVVYSTFSSTSESPRWRAIIALSRPATSAEHYRYIALVHANLSYLGVNLDPQCVDPCRLWYAPCVSDSTNFECYENKEGKLFDVDLALQTADIIEREWQEDAKRKLKERKYDSSSIIQRAASYVRKMEPAISGQRGHTATFKVARKLVKDFGLSTDEAWPILLEYNARCQPPWHEYELKHKLLSAQHARVTNPMRAA